MPIVFVVFGITGGKWLESLALAAEADEKFYQDRDACSEGDNMQYHIVPSEHCDILNKRNADSHHARSHCMEKRI